MMGNKSAERKCLNIVIKDSPQNEIAKRILKVFDTEIVDGESPDFIVGDIGVEHFLVDLIFTTKKKKAVSIERKVSADIVDTVGFYHHHPNKLDDDINNGKAVDFIEKIINSEVNGINDFSCQKFISNFNNIFDTHYKKINVYLEKCKSVGFLIEIPYMPSGNHGFIIRTDSKTHRQCLNYAPIPRAIVDKVYSANELDFVIFCLRPINSSGRKKENKIIYFDVKNKKSTIPNGLLCDEFDYALKFPNNDVVKLHLVKDDEDEQT